MSGSSARETARELLSHAIEQLPPGVLHPLDDETVLYRLLTDQLAPAERTRLDEHLLGCSKCRKHIELLCELEGLQYVLPNPTHGKVGRGSGPGTFFRSNRLLFAAAAGLLLAVGLTKHFRGTDPDAIGGVGGGVMVAQQQTETARKGDNNSDGTAAVSMTDSKRPVADAAAPAQFAVLASLANFGLSPRFSSRDVASAELQQRQSEKISALREQLIQQPRSARTLLDLAAELVLAGDDIEALELIRDVLREQPDDSLALNALGIVQASRRNYGDALQSFRKASQDETLRVPASINAADMLIRLNRFSDAAALLQPLAADPSRSDSEKQSIQQVLDYLSRP